MRPKRHERGLVMPRESRSIPRPARSRTRRRASDDDLDISPALAKSGGDLLALAAAIRGCAACGRACDDPVLGTGHPQAPVMLVADRPSPPDVESSNAFSRDGEALDKAFSALGIPLSLVYGTTLVRCGTRPATAEDVEACASHLLVEIEAIQPEVLVAFGPQAAAGMRALDGRCGLHVPDELPQGEAIRLRPGLAMVVTEPLPEGVTHPDAKRRLWKDLRRVPDLLR